MVPQDLGENIKKTRIAAGTPKLIVATDKTKSADWRFLFNMLRSD